MPRWIALLWLLLACGLRAQEAPLTNPGFEADAEGWSTWVASKGAAVSFVPGEAGHGKCARLLGSAGSRVMLSQSVPVRPQEWYEVTCRYLAGPNGDNGGTMGFLRLTFRDANGRFVDYPAQAQFLDTFDRWASERLPVKTPLSAATLAIEINQSGASEVCVDDVSVQTTQAPEPEPNTWDQLASRRSEPLWFSAWQYNHGAEHFRRYGLKYGWHYVLAEQFAEAKESRAIGLWSDDRSVEHLRREGVPAVVYLHSGAEAYRKAHYGGNPPEDIAPMLDPVWHDGYVEACRRACERLGESPGLAYVFVQDESFGRWAHGPIPADKRVSTQFWNRLEEEVRSGYGDGRFGLPEDPDDKDPYRWIAFLSWANDRWTETFARLRQVIDESGCGAKLLGPDELGTLQPLPWCDLAQYVDVFTGQSLYSRGSARQFVAGWTTKAVRDMTGRPVHNATQIVRYSGCPSPEEVQRQYSEVLHNGGEGQMLIAVEWFDRELSHHRYSAPERWATIKNLLRTMAQSRVATPQDRSLGIVFSSPSHQALGPAQADGPLLAAYSVLGPRLAAWPTMIDTYALARGRADLGGCRVLVAPYIPYERAEVYARLEQYVAAGGTLVLAGPSPLGKSTAGADLATPEFLGATAGEPRAPQRSLSVTWPSPMTLRCHGQACFPLQPASAATEIIATWPDGAAAATSVAHGSGRVILFGGDVFCAAAVSEDADWHEWWRQVLSGCGVPMDLSIWQLRIPDEALVQAEAPRDVCLTGQSYVMCQNGVYLGANEPQTGSYTLSVAPNLSPERVTGQIAFAEGNLTNRALATRGPFDASGTAKDPYNEADWADRWSAEAMSAGLHIEFALAAPRELTRLRLWYSGTLPEMSIERRESMDEPWRPLGTVPGQAAGGDVCEVEVALSGQAACVRLSLAAGAGELAIADVEVWGEAE